MSQDDRHDYRNLMKENEEPAPPPAPHGRASDEIGDILKLLLGGLLVLQIFIWLLK